MPSTQFHLDVSDIERLSQAVEQYQGKAGRVIDDILHTQGGQLINDEIMRILPASGRHWRGKRTAAKSAQPLKQTNNTLSVTISTVTKYGYLYFPDDGTNTIHHVGYHGNPRQFMQKGADNMSEKIIDLCVAGLINEWEGE